MIAECLFLVQTKKAIRNEPSEPNICLYLHKYLSQAGQ